MEIRNNRDRGRAGMSLAIGYFGSNGYTVSLPLNDTQWYDMVIEKDGIFQTVQCKFTSSEDRNIPLKSKGGTSGMVYDSVLEHPVDLLFCADEDMNMFVIPVKDILTAGNRNSISLRTSENENHQGFNTHKYLVQF